VEREPGLRALLPEVYIVAGSWNGEPLGRKTATRPHTYLNPDYPAHFPRTRCVFADAAGFCELEKLARGRGEHPWTYKPFTCWMFPLEEEAGNAVPPPVRRRDDPWRVPGYPGYVTRVPCGRHDAAGRPWRAALSQELQYFERQKGE
jgi:hypothetical protein